MKVELDWTEEVSYKSVIEVDAADVLAWLNEGEPEETWLTESDLTDADLQMYMTESDFEWFEACDTTADFYSVDERDLGSVRVMRKEVKDDAALRPGTDAG